MLKLTQHMKISTALKFGSIVGVLFVTALLLAYVLSAQKVSASAPPGLPATIYNASTTVQVVSSSQAIIAATSSCSARIISTASTSLMMTFTDFNSGGVIPTVSNGIWQAASTTKEYDSGQYGCGAIRAIDLTPTAGVVTVLLSN